MKLVLVFGFVVVLVIIVTVAGFPSSGSDTANRDSTHADELICRPSTPCAWAVYKRFTRIVDYFMGNKCQCPKNTKCLRAEDDISINAFVYRCTKPGE